MSAVMQKCATFINISCLKSVVQHKYYLAINAQLHFPTSALKFLTGLKSSNQTRLYCSSSADPPVKHEILLRRRLRQKSLQGGATDETEEFFRLAMRKVPQQVVVVTTSIYQPDTGSWIKRGVTCSTFSSVSFHPPIVSFCLSQERRRLTISSLFRRANLKVLIKAKSQRHMLKKSRMHYLIKSVGTFAVHILTQDQVHQGIHFSKPARDDICQFDSIPHVQGEEGLPIILGCLAVLLCDSHSYHSVGDHMVWYGNVLGVSVSETLQEPLIYFTRKYTSVGDEIFLKAFEDATLPFENWTHEAHLRMAWNYIKEHGKDGAVPYIKLYIQKYNEKHRGKLRSTYHETITMFFIHIVSDAVVKSVDASESFEEFLSNNKHLMDKNLILEYYNKDTLSKEQARNRFIYPDKKDLP